MIERERMNLIFAVTATQEPVYAKLTGQLPRASYGLLAQDSSNIVDLLSDKVYVRFVQCVCVLLHEWMQKFIDCFPVSVGLK